MISYLWENQCTPLGIVNGAKVIIHGVDPNLNSKSYSS